MKRTKKFGTTNFMDDKLIDNLLISDLRENKDINPAHLTNDPTKQVVDWSKATITASSSGSVPIKTRPDNKSIKIKTATTAGSSGATSTEIRSDSKSIKIQDSDQKYIDFCYKYGIPFMVDPSTNGIDKKFLCDSLMAFIESKISD